MAPISSQPILETFLLGAFNIRAFGINKLNNDEVSKSLVKILRRYDICLIQEVREADGKLNQDGTSPLLQGLLNKVSTKKKPYLGVISSSIGRGTHKEKYIYIYRSDRLKILETHLFDDDNFGDVFEREPFSAKFSVLSQPNARIAVLGIHVKPTDAVKEIGSLHHVFEKLSIKWSPEGKKSPKRKSKKWYHYLFSCICPTMFVEDEGSAAEMGNLSNFKLYGPIIMGDLNAGKNYVSKKAQEQIELFTNKVKYTWLIGDDVDTTVASSTDYPYDRIIVPTGQLNHFRNAKPFPFDDKLKLDGKTALAVSDHYPVEVQLIL